MAEEPTAFSIRGYFLKCSKLKEETAISDCSYLVCASKLQLAWPIFYNKLMKKGNMLVYHVLVGGLCVAIIVASFGEGDLPHNENPQPKFSPPVEVQAPADTTGTLPYLLTNRQLK